LPYFVVGRFPGGLDVRKPEFGADPGTASVAENVHLTRGGDWEVRKAFVEAYTLPADTFGLGRQANGLYVFGSASAPSMPSGVTYQRLQHPTAQAMTDILSVDLFNGLLYVVAEFADGSTYHFYNGARITDFVDGRARGSFTVTGGSASAGVNKLSNVKVNGIEILNVAVDWTTSNSATATAIAAQINAYNSTPEYTAVASGSTVYIIAAAAAGAGPNGYVVSTTVGGNLTVGAVTNMADGQAAAGTYTPGPFAKTHKQKMYSVSENLAIFSGVGDPTVLNPDSETAPGAGITNLSNHAAGAEELRSLGVYLNYLAYFASEAIQVWSVASDDTDNTLVQTIENEGTDSPRSVKQFADTDLFYLSRSGFRVLAPSGTVANYAVTRQIGSPIDALVTAQLSLLTDDEISRALTVVEPVENRLWAIVDDTIYVYTNFPEDKVRGWSTYLPGFTISDAVVIKKALYVRSGLKIYLYGGEDGGQYDSTVPRLRLPAVVGNAPASYKDFYGIDVGVEGLWTVKLYHNPNDTTGETLLTVADFTHDQPSNAVDGQPTHPVLEVTGQGSGYRRLVNLALHFKRYDQE